MSELANSHINLADAGSACGGQPPLIMTAFWLEAAIAAGAEQTSVYCATGPKSGLSAPSDLAGIISWQGLVRVIGCCPMSNTPTFASYDQGLVSHGLNQIIESCGLSSDEVRLLLSDQGGSNGKAELQFIELIEHLTVLVGSSPVARSDWLRTTNLDLGQTPLSLIKAPGGVEHVRDYLAGQRYRC